MKNVELIYCIKRNRACKCMYVCYIWGNIKIIITGFITGHNNKRTKCSSITVMQIY